MRKLIILLLFLVFTVLAVGFINFVPFSLATEINPEEAPAEKVDCSNTASCVIIENPLASLLPQFSQIVIAQHVNADNSNGYGSIEIVDTTQDGVEAYTRAQAAAVDATYVSGSFVYIWLFMLLLIIFLPRKISKRKVRRIAEDVVDDEMANSRPARRSYDEPRRKRNYDDDYDE